MSNLIVSRVDFENDWDDLFATYWDSWKTPLQAVGQLTFAGLGGGSQEEAASFAQTKREYLAAAKANPHQVWLKVEDPSREHEGLPRIVGGGAYTLHAENPFAAEDQQLNTEIRLPGPNYRPGSERYGLVQEFYSQMWSWRPKLMQRPHSCKLLKVHI